MKWPVSRGIYLYWPTTTKWNRFPKVTLPHSVTGNVNFLCNGTKKSKSYHGSNIWFSCAFLHFIIDTLNMNKSVLECKLKQQIRSLCDGFKYLLIQLECSLTWNWLKIYIYWIFIRNLIIDLYNFWVRWEVYSCRKL